MCMSDLFNGGKCVLMHAPSAEATRMWVLDGVTIDETNTILTYERYKPLYCEDGWDGLKWVDDHPGSLMLTEHDIVVPFP